MKKSKDISKYDIDWQVFRVKLKDLSTLEQKVEAAVTYFEEHSNKADRERVVNYLEGLAMAYKGNDRQFVLKAAQDLYNSPYSNENKSSQDFSRHSEEDLLKLAKDLLARSSKWLKKGYRHTEEILFLLKLLEYLITDFNNSQAKLIKNKLVQLINLSKDTPNTHKFFF